MGLNIGFGLATERTETVRLIRAAFDRGITFFDTAEGYGAANEEMLGEAVAPFRGKVVVASKFGFNEGGYTAGMNSRPERIGWWRSSRASASRSKSSTFSINTG
jgi:aryl-alcohol dehydrogenase-like predicted oxidoreductase